MGLRIFGGSSYSVFDNKPNIQIITERLPNPNPNNYSILEFRESRRVTKDVVDRYNILIKIKYHDCTNYEGVKILLFKDCTLEQLKEQGSIDPHFSESKEFHSPIARFEPTDFGWLMGMNMLKAIT